MGKVVWDMKKLLEMGITGYRHWLSFDFLSLAIRVKEAVSYPTVPGLHSENSSPFGRFRLQVERGCGPRAVWGTLSHACVPAKGLRD